MVKYHTDSERGNPLPPHGLLFPINSKGSFILYIPRPLLHQSWSTGWNVKLSFNKYLALLKERMKDNRKKEREKEKRKNENNKRKKERIHGRPSLVKLR